MDIERLAEYFSPTAGYSAVALVFITWTIYKYHSVPRYPPGPPKFLPWIGSLVYIPKHKAWETYQKWGKEYNSDVLHLQGARVNIVVLNSIEAVGELLDKRSVIYSSRPAFSVFEMMNWEWAIITRPQTTAWRERRKLAQKHLNPSRTEICQSKFLSSLRERLIPDLLEHPEDWANILRYAIGSTTLSLTYGIPFQKRSGSPKGVDDDQDDNPRSLDSLINLGERAVGTLNIAYASGAAIIDLIPILKYFPSWFPGLGFKAKLPEWRRLAVDCRELPFNVAQSLIAEGKAEESLVSLCMDDGEELDVVKDTAGTMFPGGVETTVALLHNFILAMLIHPEVQKLAQQELDQLLAAEKHRVPEWSDKDKLPYFAAVLKEVLRWRPVHPLGVPHAVTQDDEYQGYLIPKDSIIIPNTWLMLHNEETYGPNPDKFQPERFLDRKGRLNEEVKDPADLFFGFGRRGCPARQLALYNFFMIASHILYTFNIEYAVDENGVIKMPSLDWPDLAACSPLPFDCKFISRKKWSK